jgi:hypothetical protein
MPDAAQKLAHTADPNGVPDGPVKSQSVFDPLTKEKIKALRGCATDSPKADPELFKRLTARGYVLKTKSGFIVTPEGLAALLEVPSR